jgi:hypothetical protein
MHLSTAMFLIFLISLLSARKSCTIVSISEADLAKAVNIKYPQMYIIFYQATRKTDVTSTLKSLCIANPGDFFYQVDCLSQFSTPKSRCLPHLNRIIFVNRGNMYYYTEPLTGSPSETAKELQHVFNAAKNLHLTYTTFTVPAPHANKLSVYYIKGEDISAEWRTDIFYEISRSMKIHVEMVACDLPKSQWPVQSENLNIKYCDTQQQYMPFIENISTGDRMKIPTNLGDTSIIINLVKQSLFLVERGAKGAAEPVIEIKVFYYRQSELERIQKVLGQGRQEKVTYLNDSEQGNKIVVLNKPGYSLERDLEDVETVKDVEDLTETAKKKVILTSLKFGGHKNALRIKAYFATGTDITVGMIEVFEYYGKQFNVEVFACDNFSKEELKNSIICSHKDAKLPVIEIFANEYSQFSTTEHIPWTAEKLKGFLSMILTNHRAKGKRISGDNSEKPSVGKTATLAKNPAKRPQSYFYGTSEFDLTKHKTSIVLYRTLSDSGAAEIKKWKNALNSFIPGSKTQPIVAFEVDCSTHKEGRCQKLKTNSVCFVFHYGWDYETLVTNPVDEKALTWFLQSALIDSKLIPQADPAMYTVLDHYVNETGKENVKFVCVFKNAKDLKESFSAKFWHLAYEHPVRFYLIACDAVWKDGLMPWEYSKALCDEAGKEGLMTVKYKTEYLKERLPPFPGRLELRVLKILLEFGLTETVL